MLPRTLRELALVCITALLMAAAVGLLGFGLGRLDFAQYAGALCTTFALGLCTAYLGVCHRRDPVDPWYLQQALMEKSGQATPRSPQVNKHVITYLALVLEEWAETATEVRTALGGLNLANASPAVQHVWAELDSMTVDVNQMASNLRHRAKLLDERWVQHFTDTQAVLFADGVTDQAVVVAGLAIAGGIPGAACYEEVVGSNLSKANPLTGLIDKDATGKWIKGVNYQPPNLRAVLASHGRIDSTVSINADGGSW